PESPATAIYSEDDIPPDQVKYITLNADLAQSWPVITRRKDPLPEAAQWNGVSDKLQYLKR
ncbi:MAG: DUF3470 domain-containing protein, partial [Gammaproteobacteria bacterium]|nr:DUF3470 domain-containing protein [Gammaproteobacteria bacterium]